MRYVALATDYDGTLALNGRVPERVLTVLGQVRRSGRRLILVSGRELEDLQTVFDHLDLFDLAVLENGGLLYDPVTKKETTLGDGPPERLVDELKRRGVRPLSVGRVIVATWEPHQEAALQAIRECGLEHQVIFNKGAVMLLPAGVNKATGLSVALRELGLSRHNVVGIGDAENDHAFLRLCECAVAVENAVPALKKEVDWTTRADHARGVEELCEQLLQDDLASLERHLKMGLLVLGHADGGTPVGLPYAANLLVTGSSGGGKSTFTASLVERLLEQQYQFVIVDPEGDYEELGDAAATGQRQQNVVVLGGPERPPSMREIEQLLQDPTQSAVVNMLGVPFDDRPRQFIELLPHLQQMRTRTGRPHWIILDEAHHVLPAESHLAPLSLSQNLKNVVMIAVRPQTVSSYALETVDHVVLIGSELGARLEAYGRSAGLEKVPELDLPDLPPGRAVLWSVRDGAPPREFQIVQPTITRRRHKRKYAEGELADVDSFHFRGREGKLNLRARNLVQFTQLAEGVDDDTWMWHLKKGEYSRWFRDQINDEELAARAAEVEAEGDGLSADESRERIRDAITRIYTLPA